MHPAYRTLLSLASALIGLWVSSSNAQGSASSPDTTASAVPRSVADLSTVTVTGHYENAIGTSDAASQGIVRGERLKDLPLLRPGDVLETIPGLVVTQHSGDGKANQYFLRGYNLDHGTDFATFVDGVPVNMPTHAHGQGYSDLNYLVPELVDSIEYRKGPYFADGGDFSAAGSARIRYVDRLEHSVADLTMGSFGYRRALLAGSQPMVDVPADSTSTRDGARLLGALELQENDGPWTVAERLRKLNGLLRLSQGNRAAGWSIDANLYSAHWDSTDPVPLALIQSGQLGRYSALDPTDGGNSGRVILAGEWHERDARGYSRASAYVEHYRMQLWSNFTFFELRPNTGDQFEQREHRTIVGGEAARGWTHTLLGRESVTEAGVQLRHDRVRVGLLNTEARIPFATVSDNDVSETGLGVYVQNTTHWTEWFRSLVGLREDHIQMKMTAIASPQNGGTASGSKFSPKISLIFGPWRQTEFFANAGYGFHSNDARGAIDKIDPATGAPVATVPALVAARGAELGVRTEIIAGLQSSLAVWWLNSESEIVYSADSAIGSTQPNGASKRYGLEWNNHLVVDHWWLFDADMSWIRARYAHDNDNGDVGNAIPNAVPKVATFGATFKPAGPWSGGIMARYMGGYPLSQDASLTAPAAIVTNVLLQRVISASVTLRLEALNVFDRQYVDIAYQQDYRVAPTSPTVPAGVTVHPGEPRQFRMALNVRF